jgi:hypothetical protein
MVHFGLYWSRVPSKHPDQEIKPPLVLVLDLDPRWTSSGPPAARRWVVSSCPSPRRDAG